MANRTGTYIAFDGLGNPNPKDSDFRYYSTIQMWAAGKGKDFKYTDSHEKTAAVRDSSLKETLKGRIRERLASSKQCLVIISSDTRKSGSMLSYEIEKAVDLYGLPLIIAYVGYEKVTSPYFHSFKWPSALENRIANQSAKAIHIPFKKKAINQALSQFQLNNLPKASDVYYTSAVQNRWNSTYDL